MSNTYAIKAIGLDIHGGIKGTPYSSIIPIHHKLPRYFDAYKRKSVVMAPLNGVYYNNSNFFGFGLL